MAITYFDTVGIEEIAKEISSLVDEYNNEINNLFNRFSKVTTVTLEWRGTKADFYFNKIANDKEKFINFGNSLKSISDNLNISSAFMNNCVNKNINGEK